MFSIRKKATQIEVSLRPPRQVQLRGSDVKGPIVKDPIVGSYVKDLIVRLGCEGSYRGGSYCGVHM
jgi:hypothetical protein